MDEQRDWFEVRATQADGSRASVLIPAHSAGQALAAGRRELEAAGMRAHPELTMCSSRLW